jgi:hypothetical protein
VLLAGSCKVQLPTLSHVIAGWHGCVTLHMIMFAAIEMLIVVRAGAC